jgi:Fuc2NAc and GlcNAc transferase
MIKIFFYIIACVATFIGVEIFRRWSLRRKLFDVPNERSSHTVPTPRGGGLIIDIVCLFLLFIYCLIVQKTDYWSYFAGALIVGAISWLDDLYTISNVWRFLCHSIAAILIIFGMGFWEFAYVPFFGVINLGLVGQVITFFWIVWLINAYNFMDGIDGIAGTQALTAGLGWLIIGTSLQVSDAAFYGGVIAFSSLGFLFHNWQPAKIFMGDVGSAFLGYTFAVLPLIWLKESKNEQTILPVVAVALVALFMFDSLVTISKRALQGEKIWQAHRQHIYQRLIIAGLSHRRVTIIYFSISLLILLLLFFWIKNKESYGDFSLIFIIPALIFLFIYGYGKKSLT